MAKELVTVRALLVSRNIQTIETLSRLMQQMAMHVELCRDVESALRKLCHTKFEAVIVDFEEKEGALKLLSTLHELTSHKQAVAYAVLSGTAEVQTAFRAGATFVLEKPLSAGTVLRTLRAAYPLMVRERRRCFRCPMQAAVSIRKESGPEFNASSVNLSETGIAINSAVPLQAGEKLRLVFRLPDTSDPLTVTGEVCWAEPTGQAGLQFVAPSPKFTELLRSWLSERLQDLLPATGAQGTHGERSNPSVFAESTATR